MSSQSIIDIRQLDNIVKKTIDVINEGKREIFDIAESARRECMHLEQELEMLKRQVVEITGAIEKLERLLKSSKKKLLAVNKYHENFSQSDARKAYENADNVRVELAVKREQENNLIRSRNDLEIRLKRAYKTVERADNLIAQVGTALDYLTGDLSNISDQLEDIHQKQWVGYKIIKAQEEERQRLARDIHDGPAQSLSNVVLKAEICERLIDTDLEQTRQQLKQLRATVRESLQDVRKIIYNLRPMSLDDLGLIPTLQRFISTLQDETGISASFSFVGYYDDIKSEIALTIFRIVQEATNNIKKHAEAKNITIRIEFCVDCIRLLVSDDGKGFDVDEVSKKGKSIAGGFGLISMRERIELLNGTFNITSGKGKGTRLNVFIPFISDKEDNVHDNSIDSR